jgi:hypothetical protein
MRAQENANHSHKQQATSNKQASTLHRHAPRRMLRCSATCGALVTTAAGRREPPRTPISAQAPHSSLSGRPSWPLWLVWGFGAGLCWWLLSGCDPARKTAEFSCGCLWKWPCLSSGACTLRSLSSIRPTSASLGIPDSRRSSLLERRQERRQISGLDSAQK